MALLERNNSQLGWEDEALGGSGVTRIRSGSVSQYRSLAVVVKAGLGETRRMIDREVCRVAPGGMFFRLLVLYCT